MFFTNLNFGSTVSRLEDILNKIQYIYSELEDYKCGSKDQPTTTVKPGEATTSWKPHITTDSEICEDSDEDTTSSTTLESAKWLDEETTTPDISDQSNAKNDKDKTSERPEKYFSETGNLQETTSKQVSKTTPKPLGSGTKNRKTKSTRLTTKTSSSISTKSRTTPTSASKTTKAPRGKIPTERTTIPIDSDESRTSSKSFSTTKGTINWDFDCDSCDENETTTETSIQITSDSSEIENFSNKLISDSSISKSSKKSTTESDEETCEDDETTTVSRQPSKDTTSKEPDMKERNSSSKIPKTSTTDGEDSEDESCSEDEETNESNKQSGRTTTENPEYIKDQVTHRNCLSTNDGCVDMPKVVSEEDEFSKAIKTLFQNYFKNLKERQKKDQASYTDIIEYVQ